MKLDSFETLALHGLQDILSAEQQAVTALPLMAKAAHAPELKAAFQDHLAQTEEQVARVEEILASMGAKTGGDKCLAMQGLIAEGQKLIKEGGHPEVLDAALICAQQKIEHYEIAAYGTAATLAEQMGDAAALKLLKKTLAEEKATDEKLTKLAEARINQKAAAH